MGNKEMKKLSTEINDELLEDVAGGVVKEVTAETKQIPTIIEPNKSIKFNEDDQPKSGIIRVILD